MESIKRTNFSYKDYLRNCKKNSTEIYFTNEFEFEKNKIRLVRTNEIQKELKFGNSVDTKTLTDELYPKNQSEEEYFFMVVTFAHIASVYHNISIEKFIESSLGSYLGNLDNLNQAFFKFKKAVG
jgi:hypothetical protein